MQRELSSQLRLLAHKEVKVRDIFLLRQATDGRPFKMEPADCINGRTAPYVLRVEAVAVPLSVAARSLSTALRRPVLDETGLSGCFSFNLTWGSEADLQRTVRDQVGLDLQAARRPIEILVVDHVERWPSAVEKK